MLKGTLIGGELLAEKLGRLGVDVRTATSRGIARACLRILAKVKAEKLTGEVLNVRTGRLRRSITTRMLDEASDRPAGVVGTNVGYGAAWEYGFDRKIGAGARGGPRTLLGKARETYFAKHPPGTKHYAERSFLRTALEEMRPAIGEEINAALGRAIVGGGV